MTETQTQPLSAKIYGNAIGLTAAVFIVWCVLNYFVVGGFPYATQAANYVGLATPFMTIVGAGFLIIKHVRHISRRDSNWWGSIIVLATMIGLVAYGLPRGTTDPWFTYFYAIFGQGVPGGIYSMSSICITVGYLRMYNAKTPLKTVILITGLFTVGAFTGVWALVAPWLVPVYEWSQIYLIGQVEFMVWMAYYIGMLALMVRIFLFQEKLRAGR